MDSIGQENESIVDLLSPYSVEVTQHLEIAHINQTRPEGIKSAGLEEISGWAKTKSDSIARGRPRENRLYQSIIDKYEIRVLEIKPGKPSDELKGSLHHCSLEFRIDETTTVSFALSMNDLSIPVYYTALSYTWGAPDFCTRFECDGHVKMITKSLGSALRHFRREDRAVMLWVDQICIDQENNNEKGQQILLMSRIYEQAFNTAIWLGDSADDSDRAIQLLKDIYVCLQYSSDIIDATDFGRRDLPHMDSDDWEGLWKSLSRPWFERLWIIQEVTLSTDAWVICGGSEVKWQTLVFACKYLVDTGISQWLTGKFPTSKIASDCRDWCRHVSELSDFEPSRIRQKYTLLGLLTYSRGALCADPRDKAYGLFALCNADQEKIRVDYSDRYNATQLYQDILEPHINGKRDLGIILRAVDHDSADLPSWVPDWRLPRRTVMLGRDFSSYQADGDCHVPAVLRPRDGGRRF